MISKLVLGVLDVRSWRVLKAQLRLSIMVCCNFSPVSDVTRVVHDFFVMEILLRNYSGFDAFEHLRDSGHQRDPRKALPTPETRLFSRY